MYLQKVDFKSTLQVTQETMRTSMEVMDIELGARKGSGWLSLVQL